MKKLFDQTRGCLVMIGRKASARYWDNHWTKQRKELNKLFESAKQNLLLKKTTQKYLAPGAKVLEGGCGLGQNVYALGSWGYEAWGVDYAKETVEKVKEFFPQLKLSVQDVRRLDFENGFFDGYWSIGVIEHFPDGYLPIIKEAKRVLKKGGYLFLTFPYFSPLRKLKALLGLYPKVKVVDRSSFYQYILDANQVVERMKRLGFILEEKRPFDAVKGLKDDISCLRPVLQGLYDSSSFTARVIKFVLSILLGWLVGHSVLLVFKKS